MLENNMRSPEAELILHIGAPKCGSSALQTALSKSPELLDRAGQRFLYSAWRHIDGVGELRLGRDVAAVAQASPYGYASWPDVRPQTVDAGIFAALNKLRMMGLRDGFVPIASSEGWIRRPESFAKHLAAWGYPPVKILAFLRPVIDWTNAAFWQWGVWNFNNLEKCLAWGGLKYSFASDLEQWSQIPNVQLCIAPARPDAVAQFAEWHDVALAPAAGANVSSPPALIGLLLRHRRFRPNSHKAAVEFIFQRWCPPVSGRRLWAVTQHDLRNLQPISASAWGILQRLIPDADLSAFKSDPRWLEENCYQPEIEAQLSPLNDPAQLAGLHASLKSGLLYQAKALKGSLPDLPSCPALDAEITEWDSGLVIMLDALVAGDERHRRAARPTGYLAKMFRC